MPRRRQRIWITRAQPAADVTAERVRALGHEALVAPLLAVHLLDDVQIEPAGELAELVTAGAALVHAPSPARAVAGVQQAHRAAKSRTLVFTGAVINPRAPPPWAGRASPPFPLEAALLNLIDRHS